MRKIRADLVGVVMAGGHLLVAGQDVPEGVDVHESLVDAPAKSKKAPESNEKGADTSESTGAASDAGNGKGTPAEAEDEDFSDLLGDAAPKSAPKSAPKRG